MRALVFLRVSEKFQTLQLQQCTGARAQEVVWLFSTFHQTFSKNQNAKCWMKTISICNNQNILLQAEASLTILPPSAAFSTWTANSWRWRNFEDFVSCKFCINFVNHFWYLYTLYFMEQLFRTSWTTRTSSTSSSGTCRRWRRCRRRRRCCSHRTSPWQSTTCLRWLIISFFGHRRW